MPRRRKYRRVPGLGLVPADVTLKEPSMSTCVCTVAPTHSLLVFLAFTELVARKPTSFSRGRNCTYVRVAEREGVFVKEVKPNYTSQTCPRCGHVSRENWKGYVYFKCVKCGYEADRDRVASLNLALRAALAVFMSLRVRNIRVIIFSSREAVSFDLLHTYRKSQRLF